MADDSRSRLTTSQTTLRTQLDALEALVATAPDDPRCAKLTDEVHDEVRRLLQARRDIDAAELRLHTLVLGAAAVVIAVVGLVFWFSAWNVVPLLLSLAVGSALVINPPLHGDWEPSARRLAGVAAVLSGLLTPLVGGWSVLLVLAGIGWWAWRYRR
ncbi:hypothetical protein ABZ345_06885 [Lentzea sp. NPDC005914]|uniref:hypothetical protein n=1 Tax=Lentzea sp. NPDC005914 TaxID=3154572 RepID=UPI0033E4EF26